MSTSPGKNQSAWEIKCSMMEACVLAKALKPKTSPPLACTEQKWETSTINIECGHVIERWWFSPATKSSWALERWPDSGATSCCAPGAGSARGRTWSSSGCWCAAFPAAAGWPGHERQRWMDFHWLSRMGLDRVVKGSTSLPTFSVHLF